MLGILRAAFLRAFLIAEENIGVAVPVDAVVAHTLLFNHLFQFRPDGSMALGVLFLTTRLEEHFKRESSHHIFTCNLYVIFLNLVVIYSVR